MRIYIKLSKTCQLNIIKKIKKDCIKNITKDIKIFLKKKKKSNNMVVNVTKTSQKIKKKSLLNIEKNVIE